MIQKHIKRKAIQRISFNVYLKSNRARVGNAGPNLEIYFIYKQLEETILEFSQVTVKDL